MLFAEITSLLWQSYKTHRYTETGGAYSNHRVLCGQTAELLNVTAGCTSSYHCSLVSAVQRFYTHTLGRIWLMAVEAWAPCGDCNNNNNNKVMLIKILTYFIFMAVFPKIFWSSHKIIFICKQESAVRVNWVKTDLWQPDNNSDLILEAESAQMRYLFEEMTWDAGAFSSEKGKCGVRGQ
jgi:hypothetical protein